LKKNRILIITYYWPPSGGIGVLRCLKFAKYLSRLGWEITVFTVENGHYPYIDHSNDKDIPENIKVIRTKIWEPYHLYKKLSGSKDELNVNNIFSSTNKKRGWFYHFSVWIRSNFFIPDARARWVDPSVNYLTKYLNENRVDVILSNGPPHSNTRIATLLKKKFKGIKWHADFQDPWSQVDYFSQLHLTKWAVKKHYQMEQEVFKYADSISIVSKTWKRDLEKIGASDVQVLEWGFDPEDYDDIKVKLDAKFTITHSGIMGYDRNPTQLFKVLDELIQENEGFKNHFSLKIIGEIDSSVLENIKRFNLTKYCDFRGFVTRDIAIQETFNSHVLLLLLNQQVNAAGRIPGKLFEYLASRRPIILIGPKNSDSENIVHNTHSGQSFVYDNQIELKNYITKLYDSYVFLNPNFNKSSIDEYNLIHITKRLNNLLLH